MTAALSYLWNNPAARYVRPASSPFSSVRKTIARLVGTLNVGLSGRFHLVKRRINDDSIVEAREFENIITDAGLNRWGSGAVVDRCMVGSGNTTPRRCRQSATSDVVHAATSDLAGTRSLRSIGRSRSVTSADDVVTASMPTVRQSTRFTAP